MDMDRPASLADVVRRFSEGHAAQRWAEMYDAPTRILEEANYRRRCDVTVGLVKRVVPPGGCVLDLGCGTAPVLSELRKHGIACTGLELAPDMIARAHSRLRSMGLDDGDLYQGDCRQTPFEDASFDVVVCLGVISYVEAFGEVLREIERLLKPGGHVLVSFRNRFNPMLWDPYVALKTLARAVIGRPEAEPYVIGRFMDFRDVCAEMASCGFEYQEHFGIGFGPIRFRRRALLPEAVSIKLNDGLAATFGKLGWAAPFRWLADVSLWVYRKPEEPRSNCGAEGPGPRRIVGTWTPHLYSHAQATVPDRPDQRIRTGRSGDSARVGRRAGPGHPVAVNAPPQQRVQRSPDRR